MHASASDWVLLHGVATPVGAGVAAKQGGGGRVAAGVVTCVVKTNCSGLACYSPTTCKTEIDAAGGLFGKGTEAAQKVGDCVASACVGCDL